MNLNIYNETRIPLKDMYDYSDLFREIFEKTIKVLNLSTESCVSVIFVRDRKMHKINNEYRNVDRTTDVISFALADNKDEFDYVEEELGDIFINIDAANRQAESYGHSVIRETCFLFTHGLLHLCGFDHMKKEDEEEMIKYQKLILDDIISR